MQLISRVALTATVLTGLAACVHITPVEAFPPFTKKEGKPCGYCHVQVAGGGKRNYRGMYYKAHNLTFTEFDDAAEAKKAGEEVALDPDPNTKPTSYTAPKTVEAPSTPTEAPVGTERPATATEKKLTLVEAAARVKAAEVAYKKAPKNAAKKKAYGAALSDLGHATMMEQSIRPGQRYQSALMLVNNALKLDPTNAQAKADKKAIVNAYKSLGKPVPK